MWKFKKTHAIKVIVGLVHYLQFKHDLWESLHNSPSLQLKNIITMSTDMD